MEGADAFHFLNESGRLIRSEDWNDPRRDKLWLYNLHYFDDLNAEDAESRQGQHQNLVLRWIRENPPTIGNGWEPYSISLRVVNWIKWDLRQRGLDSSAVISLALQLRWLRRRLEHHLLGNHLLANAKALVFGGLYFHGSEADDWLRTGVRLLERELIEQVLPDGGHFERSPMYHLIVLEDLLDLIGISLAYGRTVPAEWLDTARRMLHWAAAMRHPDGRIPFFNDAAFGIAGSHESLQAHAMRLGLDPEPVAATGSAQKSNSDYLCIANEDAHLFFDAAAIGPDYLPGHAHADTLSLELSLFDHRVLVNSGTSVYGLGLERQRQRSTDAHNTVMIDGESSSEVWSSFRVARRARVHDAVYDRDKGVAGASHDGYLRLPGRPVHARRATLKERALVVKDTVDGRGIHAVQGAWHLHPNVDVAPDGDAATNTFLLRVPADGRLREARLSIQGPVTVTIEDSTWHPEFGLAVPNRRLVFRYHGELPVSAVTHIRW